MSDMTIGEIRHRVYEAVDEHMRNGGCIAAGQAPAHCIVCSTGLSLLYDAGKSLLVHYTDDFEKYASTACGEMVGNTWARSGEPETEDVSNDWGSVNCEKCITGRKNYEERWDAK